MKYLKRIISAVLCLSLILCLPLGASAATFDDTEDYIEFTSGNERMTSDGSFTFNISQWVNTTVFTADSSTIRIDTAAQIKDGAATHTDSSVKFTVTLYKAATGEVVGSYQGNADYIYGGRSFSVVQGAKYYIKIAVASGQLYGTEKLNGYGAVSPVHL